MKRAWQSQQGFTLVEMALVMLILGFLGVGLLSSMSGWMENRNYVDTRRQMDRIEEALMGHVLATGGGFPAADTDQDGLADVGQALGELPWRTLGLSRRHGLDAWGRPLRYHVDGNYRETLPPMPPDTVTGLRVEDFVSDQPLTLDNPNAPVVVLVSYGANGNLEGSCSDNGDADPLYRLGNGAACPGPNPVALDDEVRWISRYTLLGRLVDAGIWPR